MSIIIGTRFNSPVLYRMNHNKRVLRLWGVSIGWWFLGVVTFPRTEVE